MRHAPDTEGNTPYLLFSANTEAPSRLMLAANRYLSLKLRRALKNAEMIVLSTISVSGLLTEEAELKL